MADRLAESGRFVGRAAELELLRSALDVQPPPFAVLHIYGPGGVGKSSLLRQYQILARQAGRLAVWLDGRDIDPSPPGFLGALGQALGLPPTEGPLAVLSTAEHPVLLLDTYEVLAPLDAWLRESFLPQLPSGALAIITGRHPPAAGWRGDSAWRELVRIVSLRNLRPDESLTYLTGRGVPPAQHTAVLRFTHGHPLALSLVAEVAAQAAREGTEAIFQPAQAPDVVALLLERFVQQVPSPHHRLALHACAQVRVLTEPVLRAALEQPDVAALFAWLRGLSFIEAGPFGLFPHDLAREVLDSDLRWRDPEAYQALHGRVREQIIRRLMEAQGAEQQRAMFDLVYLHRHNPILQPYYQWHEFGAYYAEPARPADRTAIGHRVAAFTGSDRAAALAEFWLDRQPAAWHVIRDPRGEIAGLFMYLALHAAAPDDRAHDPAAAAAWDYVQRQAPLRPGDEVALARIFVEPATYREPLAVLNTAQMAIGLRWLTNPRLAWSFNDLFDPDHWHPMMSYYDFRRVPGTHFGLYAHDWRAVPAEAWLALVGSRELATDLRVEDLAATPSDGQALLVLSQPEFEDAVREALRDVNLPQRLAASPLMRSRLVADASAASSGPAALQRLLRAAADSLRASPRDEKFFRALEMTYLSPAPNQEAAAERLGLPFSTYRYHLTQGLKRLTEWLWQRELHGP